MLRLEYFSNKHYPDTNTMYPTNCLNTLDFYTQLNLLISLLIKYVDSTN